MVNIRKGLGTPVTFKCETKIDKMRIMRKMTKDVTIKMLERENTVIDIGCKGSFCQLSSYLHKRKVPR